MRNFVSNRSNSRVPGSSSRLLLQDHGIEGTEGQRRMVLLSREEIPTRTPQPHLHLSLIMGRQPAGESPGTSEPTQIHLSNSLPTRAYGHRSSLPRVSPGPASPYTLAPISLVCRVRHTIAPHPKLLYQSYTASAQPRLQRQIRVTAPVTYGGRTGNISR